METNRSRTEERKLNSQALDQAERARKKAAIVRKKEAKERALESVPTSAPEGWKGSCCRGISHPTYCPDHATHQAEWNRQERRVLVKDAHREAGSGQGGRRTRQDRRDRAGRGRVHFCIALDDFDEDDFEEDLTYLDYGSPKQIHIVDDLSAFLVNRSQPRKAKKQTIKISFNENYLEKPKPIYTDSTPTKESEDYDIPEEFLSALAHPDEAEAAGSLLLLDTSDLLEGRPAGWSVARGATEPPRLLLEHDVRDLTILLAELAGSPTGVSLCRARLVVEAATRRSPGLQLPRDRAVLSLEQLCRAGEQAGALLRQDLGLGTGCQGWGTRDRPLDCPALSLLCRAEARDRAGEAEAALPTPFKDSWQVVGRDDEQEDLLVPSVCDICLEESVSSFCLAACGHSYCPACWRRQLASSPGCPALGCPATADLATLAWALLAPGSLPAWHLHLRPAAARLLPARCRRCGRHGERQAAGTRCACGEQLCPACGQGEHWPASCGDYGLADTLSREEANIYKVEVEVRSCPNCGECWEKWHGCNHMICGRCHSSFCWSCGRAGSKHQPNGRYCGSYTPEVPLERRTVSWAPWQGLSSDRLEALTDGLQRLKKGQDRSQAMSLQPRRVVREMVARTQPDLFFHHTRRAHADMEMLPYFRGAGGSPASGTCWRAPRAGRAGGRWRSWRRGWRGWSDIWRQQGTPGRPPTGGTGCTRSLGRWRTGWPGSWRSHTDGPDART